MTPAQRKMRFASADRGMGMIEIVVSMFLIAILAIAMLPILVSTMKLTATNVVITRATQVVSAQLDMARAQTDLEPTCTALAKFKTDAPIFVADSGAQALQYTRVVGACSATSTYPTTLSIVASVKLVSSGVEIATATTLVAVSSFE
jgi:type II secretory pathway pseudopilin PulG